MDFINKGRKKKVVPTPSFEEYSHVALRLPIARDGVKLKAGTRGTIVHKHAGGKAYEVEFADPQEVVTIYSGELERA